MKRKVKKYYPVEVTAREARELANALSVASVTGKVAEPRARRLWLLFDSLACREDK